MDNHFIDINGKLAGMPAFRGLVKLANIYPLQLTES